MQDRTRPDTSAGRPATATWQPDADALERSNAARLLRERGLSSFAELHAWSVAAPEEYWGWVLARLGIVFDRPPERVLDLSPGPEQARWLPGARLNVAASCFQAPPDSPAILWGRPGRAVERIGLASLRERAERVARALRASGLEPGDAIAIDLPMTPDAVALYLGIVLAGMAVVSIPDALAAEEVALRLRIAGARWLFTAVHVERGGKRLPLYEKLLPASPPRTVVLEAGETALRPGDQTWEAFLDTVPAHAAFSPVVRDPDDVTNVLFSSGTTGEPKAIPWTHLTPIKAAADGHVHLDVRPGDVVAWPTSLGWMMGPWLVYASLLNRATLALYGDVPTGRDFGRFVQEARVTLLGLVPSIVKAWRQDDRMRGLDWSALRCFGSTGEASSPDDYAYLMGLAGGRPVIEYCGGTEIGGGYVTGSLVQPQRAATFSTPALGSAFVLLDERGQPTDQGEVFLVPPQLGSSQRLLNRDHHDVYYAGTPPGPGGVPLRRHGDQLERLPDGYFRAHGRVDDTMNLGGIKVSSAELERVLDTVPGVLRTAAIAVDPPGGGPSELVVYAVPRAPLAPEAVPALRGRLQDALKQHLNPLFRIADLVVVDSLPTTASNKVLRRELRKGYRRS